MKTDSVWVRPHIWLLLFTTAFVCVFSNKAFHIDDTLFLQAAKHIQAQPGDFYNFTFNWKGSSRPMIDSFQNPPLDCYYIAAVASLVGWSEIGLHLAFLIPALAAVWGMLALARSFCGRPIVAATVSIVTPVFLISATNLMCDVMLLAFWIWALVWFERGMRGGGWPAFFTAGLLSGLAFTTKFVGAALIPLLTVYGFWRIRRFGFWVSAIVIPLMFVLGYELLTTHLYGRGHFLDSAGVSSHASLVSGGFLERQILGLSYVGGCMLPILLLAPFIWSVRSMVSGILGMFPVVLIYPNFGSYTVLWQPDGTPNWLLCLQSAAFILSGLHVLLLPVADLWREKSAESLFLMLWVFGILFFATVCNWTLNGRSLLPMVPAVGILVARRFAVAPAPALQSPHASWLWPIGVGGALTLLWVTADYALANTGRVAAEELCARYQKPQTRLWFEGHWGFQYYMEKRGARPLEIGSLEPDAGDIIVVPSEAVNTFDLPTNLVRFVEAAEYTPNQFWATMNRSVGAGFYAATAGPFPLSTGTSDPERYYVFEVSKARGTHPFVLENPFIPGAVVQQYGIDRLIRIFTQRIRSSPLDAQAHYRLGLCFVSRNRPDSAAKEFLEALRLEPNHQLAQAELAKLTPQHVSALQLSPASGARE